MVILQLPHLELLFLLMHSLILYNPFQPSFMQQCYPAFPGYQNFYGYDYMHPNEETAEPDIDKLLEKADAAVRDQASCRFLQKKLEEGSKEVVEKIFNKLILSIDSYMNDAFGNYLCQKLFEQCTYLSLDRY